MMKNKEEKKIDMKFEDNIKNLWYIMGIIVTLASDEKVRILMREISDVEDMIKGYEDCIKLYRKQIRECKIKIQVLKTNDVYIVKRAKINLLLSKVYDEFIKEE